MRDYVFFTFRWIIARNIIVLQITGTEVDILTFSADRHITTSVVNIDVLRSAIFTLRMSECQPPSPQKPDIKIPSFSSESNDRLHYFLQEIPLDGTSQSTPLSRVTQACRTGSLPSRSQEDSYLLQSVHTHHSVVS